MVIRASQFSLGRPYLFKCGYLQNNYDLQVFM